MEDGDPDRRGVRLVPLAAIGFVALIVVVGITLFVISQRNRLYPAQINAVDIQVVTPSGLLVTADPAEPVGPRTLDPYGGLGAWLDAFDYSPNYSQGTPAIAPTVVDDMAAAGVRTIFVQAARNDDRSPDLLEDRWLLAELVLRAHAKDMQVVAWFLPKLTAENDRDLRHLGAMVDFEILGHRFDGVAVDIEADPEPSPERLAEQNEMLVTLSNQLRIISGEDTLGAIVLPPPLIEDVNENFWPAFPWTEIAPLYDVWLPMSYWSGRSNASGYGDGYNYNAESTRRIRARIGQPAAPVHGIGGIGGVAGERDFTTGEILASADDLPLFAQSLVDTDSIGGSIYDWRTLDDESRALMTELFTRGVASELSAG